MKQLIFTFLMLFSANAFCFAQSTILDSELLYELQQISPAEGSDIISTQPADTHIGYAWQLAQHWQQQGNALFAESYYEFVLERAIAYEDAMAAASASFKIANIKYYRNQVDESINIMRKAAEFFRQAGNELWYVESRMRVGNIQHLSGRLQDSLQTYDAIIYELKHEQNKNVVARALYSSAMLLNKLARTADVPRRLKLAQELYIQSNDYQGSAHVSRAFGNYYLKRGDNNEAIFHYSVYKELGNDHGLANIYYNLGLAYNALNVIETAIDMFSKSIIRFTSAGTNVGVGMAQTELARVYFEADNIDKAEDIIEQGIRQLRMATNVFRLAQALELYGQILSENGSKLNALEAYHESLNLFQQSGEFQGVQRLNRLIETEEGS
jgi:tetratricopeptide (TPR) repeat protein